MRTRVYDGGVSFSSLWKVLVVLLILTTGLLGCQPEPSDDGIHNNDQEQNNAKHADEEVKNQIIPLPGIEELEDEIDESVTLRDAIDARRSIRDYSGEPVEKTELSVLLHAAQGITDPQRDYRATPSAGATYPMEIYIVVGENLELSAGIYRYQPKDHELQLVKEGDFREDLMAAALNQGPVGEAPLSFVITSVYDRVTGRYGERGERYAKIEAGHISQNIYLQSTALGLGTVAIGAFEDQDIKELMELKDGEAPLYVMPVGRTEDS